MKDGWVTVVRESALWHFPPEDTR